MSTPDYQRVADSIAQQIAAGTLKPGDKLPSIAELALEYEIGQTTVKSALMVLRGAGLIVGRQGKGTFVKS